MRQIAIVLVVLSVFVFCLRALLMPEAVVEVWTSPINYISGLFMGWAIASPNSPLAVTDE